MQKLRIMYILKLLLRLQTFFSAQSLCSSSSCIMMEHAFWMSPSISDCVVVVAAQGEQPIMLLLPPPPAADLTMIRGPHDSPPSNSGQRSANPHTLRTVAIHSKQKRKQTGINVLQMMLFHVKECGENCSRGLQTPILCELPPFQTDDKNWNKCVADVVPCQGIWSKLFAVDQEMSTCICRWKEGQESDAIMLCFFDCNIGESPLQCMLCNIPARIYCNHNPLCCCHDIMIRSSSCCCCYCCTS